MRGYAAIRFSTRWVIGLALPLLLISSAHAQEEIACRVGDDALLHCRIDATAAFDAELFDLLNSGFTNNLVYRVLLFEVDNDDPRAIAVVAFAEVFRLYTEVYYITREGVEGYVAREDWDTAVSELGRFSVPMGTPDELGAGPFVAAVVLEVNPLSAEQLAEARSWIAGSSGGYSLFGQGDESFFGTFVSLFVNTDQSSAEAVRRFHSRPFGSLSTEPVAVDPAGEGQ